MPKRSLYGKHQQLTLPLGNPSPAPSKRWQDCSGAWRPDWDLAMAKRGYVLITLVRGGACFGDMNAPLTPTGGFAEVRFTWVEIEELTGIRSLIVTQSQPNRGCFVV